MQPSETYFSRSDHAPMCKPVGVAFPPCTEHKDLGARGMVVYICIHAKMVARSVKAVRKMAQKSGAKEVEKVEMEGRKLGVGEECEVKMVVDEETRQRGRLHDYAQSICVTLLCFYSLFPFH